ncbi:MAG: hypothetical protein Q7S40_04865 [Opitutaceae bacterium]|nr:hypothetical protein [Opitutaceae bacterium]
MFSNLVAEARRSGTRERFVGMAKASRLPLRRTPVLKTRPEHFLFFPQAVKSCLLFIQKKQN